MSIPNELILVTGATGKQGGATARALLADGRRVRALVRDPAAPAAEALAAAGAELAVGDFDAPDTLAPALKDASGIFLVPPAAFGPQGWDVELEVTRGAAAVEAAQRHGVEHIVFTGVAALTADRKWITDGKQRIEQAITASGLRHTILRPVRFMENWLATDSVLDGFTDGVNRHVFAADKPVQSIAVEDIGAIAALTFADPNRFAGQELELAGDAVTPAAAVAAIAEATGRPLRYHRITRGEAAALGSAITTAWEHAQAGQGWHVDIPAVRALYPNLTTFDSWLATTGAAALQSLLNA